MAITKNVELVHGLGYPGQIIDCQLRNVVSRCNKGVATLEAGTCVQQDGDGFAKAFVDKPLGIVVRETNSVTPAGGKLGIQPQATGSVITEGVVTVLAGEAVAYGDDVYIGTGSAVKGMFTKAAGSDTTLAVKWEGAKFVSTATKKGDIVKIAIKLGA